MKKATIYTIQNCGYCEAAKKLLKQQGISYVEHDLTQKESEKQELIKKTGHKTMPQIFLDDEFIGGYTQLADYLKSKKA